MAADRPAQHSKPATIHQVDLRGDGGVEQEAVVPAQRRVCDGPLQAAGLHIFDQLEALVHVVHADAALVLEGGNEHIACRRELANVGTGGALVKDACRLARQAVEGGKVGALLRQHVPAAAALARLAQQQRMGRVEAFGPQRSGSRRGGWRLWSRRARCCCI
jgi:hypothetical protein